MAVNALSGLQNALRPVQVNGPVVPKLSPTDAFINALEQAKDMNITHQLADFIYAQRAAQSYTPPYVQTSTPQQLRDKYANTGLANLDWGLYTNSQGRVNPEVEQFLWTRKQQQEERSLAANGMYASFGTGAISTAGAIAGSMLDPVNVGIGMIPIAGTSKLATTALAAGRASIARAAAIRFAQGAAEDFLINGTFLTPTAMGLESMLGDDPTAREYFTSVAAGALLGGTFRSVGGLLTDATGAKQIAAYNARKATNMSPQDVDAIMITKLQQENAGNFDGDIGPMWNKAKSATYSTITPVERNLGGLAVEFEAGRAKLATTDMTFSKSKVTGKVKASVEIEGTRFTAEGKTKGEAGHNLQKSMAGQLKKYAPSVRQEKSGVYVAYYKQEQGALKAMQGYGRTKAEAVRKLNQLYSDAINQHDMSAQIQYLRSDEIRAEYANMRDAATQAKRDLAEVAKRAHPGNPASKTPLPELDMSAYSEHPEIGATVKRAYDAHREYIEATGTGAEPAKTQAMLDGIRRAQSEIDNTLLDLSVRESFDNNYRSDIFAPDKIGSPEELQNMTNEVLTAEKESVRQGQQRLNEEFEALRKEATAKESELMGYADKIQERVESSSTYSILSEDVRAEFEKGVSIAREDAEIMNSGKIDKIMQVYDACRRGF